MLCKEAPTHHAAVDGDELQYGEHPLPHDCQSRVGVYKDKAAQKKMLDEFRMDFRWMFDGVEH